MNDYILADAIFVAIWLGLPALAFLFVVLDRRNYKPRQKTEGKPNAYRVWHRSRL